MATYWENSCSFGLRYVSWYKCLVVGLVFSHLGFWSGNLFLIAPFPDLCLLVPLHDYSHFIKCSYFIKTKVENSININGSVNKSAKAEDSLERRPYYFCGKQCRCALIHKKNNESLNETCRPYCFCGKH